MFCYKFFGDGLMNEDYTSLCHSLVLVDRLLNKNEDNNKATSLRGGTTKQSDERIEPGLELNQVYNK